ncbi:phage antirepressor KilAC domain-containing protein [Kingella sp. (in: b-proteobacteria)]|uniref:phage antirepressor KilAC domain-containing protein n=1 Tax=Kingella sp. (in: b-proteobacteria) TaxID=2020713 RepID=UPI0026DD38D6|nr:phage antirepressor KilAC domain-containing protein [Kingella sp. (in: b-proteobacteria)]MDO4657931.1 phage antirepressor KilAC domain-containing protein [Kingella sp. (in: b-proteobacteria)]
MTQIIPIGKSDFAGCPKQTVNARELHAFLENRDHFSTWIKDRISQYGFVENQDFVIASGNSEAIRGGHNRLDYFLSLDMAKELSMVERNAKGKQARQYFIDCEKRLSGSLNIPQTLPDALRLAADLAERNQQQAAQIAELTPKAEAMTRIEAAQGDITVTQAAKMLKMPPKQLFDWLAQHGWLYRSGGSGVWLGYQDKVRSGCVTHSVHRYESRSTGEQRIATQVYLTPKGMGKIAEKLGA